MIVLAMSMPTLDTRETPILLHLGTAPPVEASIFLHRLGPRGQENLRDRLNGSETFLPVRLKGDGIRLVSRTAIAWIGSDRTPSQFDEDPDLQVPPLRFRARMRSGEEIIGEIQALLPDNRNRLLDFLNLKERFFEAHTPEGSAIVNKDWIDTVEPLEEQY